MLLGSGVGAGAGAFSGPLSVASNTAMPVLPLNESVLNAARFRGVIDKSKYQNDMAAAGQSAENAEINYKAAHALNDTNELIRLYFRGALGTTETENESEYYALAGKLGLEKDVAARAALAAEQIGTPTDLVRFLVREVFTPELREKLQLDAEYPETADQEFRRLGISVEYARNIWAAHWQLPAIGQLQTSFHRYSPDTRQFWEDEVNSMGLTPENVETTRQDMADLLKFSDVGIYYRDKILANLYSDLGQIQLRWLVRFRFLDFAETTYRLQRRGLPAPLARTVAQVFFCVQSITDWKDGIKTGITTWDEVLTEMAGWEIDNENVRRIVQLKVAPDTLAAVEPERDLTKKTVLDAFDLSMANEADTKKRLVDLGYSADQASFILATHIESEKMKQAKEAIRGGLTKAEVKKAYRKGVIDKGAALQALVARGMERAAALIVLDSEASK